MNNSNAAQLQHQIRQNAAEVQSYFSELNDWEKSIKKKDKALKKNPQRRHQTAEPRVRSSAQNRIGVKPSTASAPSSTHPLLKDRFPSEKEKEPSAHTYDKGYKKWDQFDVVSFELLHERSIDPTLDCRNKN